MGDELGFTLRAVGLYSLAIADSNTNGSAWAKLGSGVDIPRISGAKHIYTRKHSTWTASAGFSGESSASMVAWLDGSQVGVVVCPLLVAIGRSVKETCSLSLLMDLHIKGIRWLVFRSPCAFECEPIRV